MRTGRYHGSKEQFDLATDFLNDCDIYFNQNMMNVVPNLMTQEKYECIRGKNLNERILSANRIRHEYKRQNSNLYPYEPDYRDYLISPEEEADGMYRSPWTMTPKMLEIYREEDKKRAREYARKYPPPLPLEPLPPRPIPTPLHNLPTSRYH
ncbi:hypothetical protein TRFO_41062 [Tritrichomonas foetus]|uniref:Uncharacterized protein n=1 Tax=Tritrichomonas foetus TaxID=1144522 RepID=A0A1J4L1H4_9EUKA|nr:hypothetical protein TRFO_41062 [Tritrichomonas foetus]|eukprot:OHT17369.1 hypothetical protein TRFO_41062 [Tritrichomonas foetus]